MLTRETRRRARMLLGKWGGWMVMLERLEREKLAARAWMQREDGDLPLCLAAQIDREITDLVRLRCCVGQLVAALPAEEQQVLLLRYESGWNWTKIALKLSYDERTVRRLEERAVDELDKHIDVLMPAPCPAPRGQGAEPQA